MVDRADSLWRRFAGMFGAEALARKYGDSPPPEWRVSLDRLKDFELERGMRRLVYSGKPHIPSLPEFLRLCREVGGDDHASADARQMPPSRQLAQQPVPRWSEQANIHLLGHISRQARKRVYYATQELIQPLIEAKNAWAEDMREAETEGRLPADNGREWWDYAIGNAERAVELVRAQQRAAA